MSKNGKRPDFRVQNHGTVWVFQPLNESAIEWTDENLEIEGWQRIDQHGFATDHRPARQVVEMLMEEGFDVVVVL